MMHLLLSPATASQGQWLVGPKPEGCRAERQEIRQGPPICFRGEIFYRALEKREEMDRK
jgi:hypothetical protein